MLNTDHSGDTLQNHNEKSIEKNDEHIISTSSDSESEISLSDKIVIKSNETRLRKRITTLQTAIANLKEQLRVEKELWREDIEKIKMLQSNYHEGNYCMHQSPSRDIFLTEDRTRSCMLSMAGLECGYNLSRKNENIQCRSIRHLIDIQNYKQKLAETESMCNAELYKVKQSLQDLQALKSMTSEWGKLSKKAEPKQESIVDPTDKLEEIFISTHA